jgi:hypothetical protein
MLHVLNPSKDEFDKDHNRNVHTFLGYANETFQLLRSRSSFFTSLFTLMVPAGLPELKSDTDVDYMRSNLQLDIKDKDNAAIILESTINDSLKTSFKQIDDLMHMMAHKHGSEDGNGTLIEFYKTQKLNGKKAPFFYYVLENSMKYHEMKQAKLMNNVGISLDDHYNVKGRSKRSRSFDHVGGNGGKGFGKSVSDRSLGGGKVVKKSVHRSSMMGFMLRSTRFDVGKKSRGSIVSSVAVEIVGSTSGDVGKQSRGSHRRSHTMNSVLEITEDSGYRDSIISTATDDSRVSVLDVNDFATNPMMAANDRINKNDDAGTLMNMVNESENSKLADSIVKKDKVRRGSVNKLRRNSKRRSSWKDKHEKQVKL